ncbi:MAG TPA: SRPBCC family protein [Gemmatimonadaceae bacterium]|nr:SRPBCC family protein [Gemmatimonadaceae bacterium]
MTARPIAGSPPAERAPFVLGEMPLGRASETVDERLVHAPVRTMFEIARRVEEWPAHLAHYRSVRMRERASDGGGVVDMSADRPFGLLRWPTWWRSQMAVDHERPTIRFRHVGGITKGMDVEWTFEARADGTFVRIVHVWDGPSWPGVGIFAATHVIGPVFVHGIASRTLAGLATVAEREAGRDGRGGTSGRPGASS